MNPTWTILIATLGARRERFERLLCELLPQLEPHDGRVTVCALYNNGERPLGHIRQALVDHATSTYVSFVDDDDRLPEYFVDEVVPLLDGVVDYVGWRMQCYANGRALKPTFHSLRYRQWSEDHRGFYRDVSHLNPIRTELARLADFRRGSPPEDVAWVNQVRPSVRTEHYVDRVMYHYHASSGDSTWRPGSVRRGSYPRYETNDPNFSYHPESSLSE